MFTRMRTHAYADTHVHTLCFPQHFALQKTKCRGRESERATLYMLWFPEDLIGDLRCGDTLNMDWVFVGLVGPFASTDLQRIKISISY